MKNLTLAGIIRAYAAITSLLVVALLAAGCSLVKPGGATLVKYTPEVCVSGYVTLAECYQAPDVELPDDTAEAVNLGTTLAQLFFGLPQAELASCALSGSAVSVGPVVVVTAKAECPINGNLQTQNVVLTLKPAAS